MTYLANAWSRKASLTISDLVQNRDSLTAKLSIINDQRSSSTSAQISITTRLTEEFIMNDSTIFQMKVVIVDLNRSSSYYNTVYLRFLNKCVKDNQTYAMKFTSRTLNINNERYTSDDGMWRLIYESSPAHLVPFDVAVNMDVMPCLNSFASLHDDTELTDFELRGEDGSVHMHRAVLAAASPVLRRMLGGTWRETAEGHVDVSGTSKATLQHFKDYVYLNRLPESGLEQLLLLSKYYMMPELEQRCVDALLQTVSAVNAFEMIEFASTNKLMRLVLAIIKHAQSGKINVNDMYEQLVLCESMYEEKGAGQFANDKKTKRDAKNDNKIICKRAKK